MHKASVTLRLWALPSNFFFSLFSFNLPQFLLPFHFHKGWVVTHCVFRQHGDGANWRVLLQHRLWAQGLLPHGDLFLSPSQSPWPSNSSPSNGSSRTWITMTPRSRRCFITHTECMSITVCRSVIVCVRANGETRCLENGETNGWKRSGTKHWTRTDQNSFGPTEEQIIADCQAEIKRHEFQANYDRRSTQNI